MNAQKLVVLQHMDESASNYFDNNDHRLGNKISNAASIFIVKHRQKNMVKYLSDYFFDLAAEYGCSEDEIENPVHADLIDIASMLDEVQNNMVNISKK